MQPKPKNNLISTKSIIEMLSYLRIEIDGTEIKNNLLQSNIQHCIRLVNNTYKLEDKKTEIKTEFEIKKKNKEGQKIFSCLLKDIYRIIDKQSNEGKLTILIEKDRKKYNIMIFKSTKEVIEHFLGKLLSAKNNLTKSINDNTSLQIKQSDKPANINMMVLDNNDSKNIKNIKNIKKGNNNIYNKRKFNELYKKQKSDINLKRKKNDEILSLNVKDLNLYKDIYPMYLFMRNFSRLFNISNI